MSEASYRTFVVYVEDKPGVLNRVSSLFRRRNFNIHSLNVGNTNESGVSRMTIVIESDVKMNALTDVIKADAAMKKIYIIGQDYSFGKAVAAAAVATTAGAIATVAAQVVVALPMPTTCPSNNHGSGRNHPRRAQHANPSGGMQ